MIPAIGTIVGVYVLLRCVELLCASNSRFSGQGAKAVVSVAAILTMLIVGFLLVDLFFGGAMPLTPAVQSVPESTDRQLTPQQKEQNRRDALEELRKMGK